MMEFHIARKARNRYGFAETLFCYTGNVVLDNMPACRGLAHRINQVRDVEKHPDQAVHAGALYAMGLIDEASHALMARYREQFDPQVMKAALDWFGAQIGTDNVDKMLLAFVEQFPGSTVIRGEDTPAKWLAGSTGAVSNREAALEELLMLWLANRNEAFKPFGELFDDSVLAEKTVYKQVTAQLPDYFASLHGKEVTLPTTGVTSTASKRCTSFFEKLKSIGVTSAPFCFAHRANSPLPAPRSSAFFPRSSASVIPRSSSM